MGNFFKLKEQWCNKFIWKRLQKCEHY